jgi:hypothetical protein
MFQRHTRITSVVIREAISWANRERPKMRKHVEDTEQAALMTWARWQQFEGCKLSDYLHHSPNGGKRDAREAGRLKAQGVMAGFPDLFLFVPRAGRHGLFIELKAKGGRVTERQSEVMHRLKTQGYECKVCFGFDEAKDAILGYLGARA